MTRMTLVRLALIGGAVALSTSLIGGASYAYFASAAPYQDSTFVAASLRLAEAAESSPCTIQNSGALAPGESSSSTLFPGTDDTLPSACSYEVAYTGTVPAWIGLKVSTSSQAGSPGTEALLDGQPDGLQVIILDSYGNTFGVGSVTCQGSYPNASTCSSSNQGQLVAKVGHTFVNAGGSVDSGWSDTFVVNYALPFAAANPYQGGTAAIVLTAVAVQTAHNPLVGSPPEPRGGWS